MCYAYNEVHGVQYLQLDHVLFSYPILKTNQYQYLRGNQLEITLHHQSTTVIMIPATTPMNFITKQRIMLCKVIKQFCLMSEWLYSYITVVVEAIHVAFVLGYEYFICDADVMECIQNQRSAHHNLLANIHILNYCCSQLLILYNFVALAY